MTEQNPLSFEKAFERLEEILENLNSGKVSLDLSLKLFEEANNLIITCGKKLTQAEQKIETLIKNRDGSLGQQPKLEPFQRDNGQGALTK